MYRYAIVFKKCSPLQIVPFPRYPELQVQLYDPNVFVQNAFEEQYWAADIHSSTSAKEDRSMKSN